MIFIVIISTCAYSDDFMRSNQRKISTYIIISKISFANAMITPPKNVKKPFALIAENIKSDRLFMVESGSAASTVPVSAVIVIAITVNTCFFRMF